jgi:hypothetical protein
MIKIVREVSDLRVLMHRNERPIYFISATNFNLIGIDQWVRHFKYICYIDSYDGRHPNVFVPSSLQHEEFESIEDINNYLLQHKEVIDYIRGRGGRPAATFLMFDEETEALCKELGIAVWFRRLSCAIAATTRWRPCASAIRPVSPRFPMRWKR